MTIEVLSYSSPEVATPVFQPTFERLPEVRRYLRERMFHFLEGHGFVEVKEEEKELGLIEDLRWHAYLGSLALRDREGEFGFMLPEDELIIGEEKDKALQALKRYIEIQGWENQNPDLIAEILGLNEPMERQQEIAVVVKGVMRRVVGVPSRRDNLGTLLTEGRDKSLLKFIKVLRAAVRKDKGGDERAKVLIVGDRGALRSGKVLKKFLPRPSSSKLKEEILRILEGVIDIPLGLASTPYLGVGVIYQELMSTEMVGGVKFADIREAEAIIEEDKSFDLAILSGITSFSAKRAANLSQKLSQLGIKTIKGGLLATLDERALLEGGGDIFVGEFEGMARPVLGFVLNGENRGDSQTIFRRGKPRNTQDFFQLEVKNFGSIWCRELKDSQKVLREIFLGGDPFLDVESHYSAQRERAGQLRFRMEAAIKLRPTIHFLGKEFETPPDFAHLTFVRRGCPHWCPFCSTVRSEGQKMRSRSRESIELEFWVTESSTVVMVDQNLGAREKDRREEDWQEYIRETLLAAERKGKKLLFQTELAFFDRISGDEELLRLARKTIAAVLVGLEQPVRLRGVVGRNKEPEDFVRQLKIANSLGIAVAATVVVGAPADFSRREDREDIKPFIPYESLTPKEWETIIKRWLYWLDNLPGFQILGCFPLVPILGTTGAERLEEAGLLKKMTDDYYSTGIFLRNEPIEGILAKRAAWEINQRFYSWWPVLKRIFRTLRELKGKRAIGVILGNISASALFYLGANPLRFINYFSELIDFEEKPPSEPG